MGIKRKRMKKNISLCLLVGESYASDGQSPSTFGNKHKCIISVFLHAVMFRIFTVFL